MTSWKRCLTVEHIFHTNNLKISSHVVTAEHLNKKECNARDLITAMC